MPTRTPPTCSSKLNGVTTSRMIPVCISIGTTSFIARPISSDDRLSGETSSRSWEPVVISCIRLAPVNDAPISAVMATIPGTNHCKADPFSTSGSSGANRPRKTSGWTIANRTEAGSRKTGLSSRTMTFQVSARTPGSPLRTPARRTVSPCEWRSTGFSMMVSTTVLMLLLLRWWCLR